MKKASRSSVPIRMKCQEESVQIHLIVERRFHEAFIAALKARNFKTKTEFFREKMRKLIQDSLPSGQAEGRAREEIS